MFFKFERTVALALGAVAAAGLLTACVNTSPGPNPQVTVTAPSIPIDTSKSLREQADEVVTGYCKLRNSPVASAAAEEAKRLMNTIIIEAQKEGVQIPTFDPGSPKVCQGK